MNLFLLLWVCAAAAVVGWQLLKLWAKSTPTATARPAITVSYEISELPPSQDVDKDNWEGNFWEVEAPFPIQANLRLRYVDGSGSPSERSVAVRECGGTPYGAMLIGHCRMRDATRTFRSDRIKQCVDEDTGEVINDPYSYLRSKYETSPDYSLDKLYGEEFDLLRVLLYIGKADGQLRAAERKVITAACKVISKDVRITDEQVKSMLSNMDVPTLHSFKIAVGKINKRADAKLKNSVMKAAQAIVATQKTVSAAEQEALDYMATRFAKSE